MGIKEEAGIYLKLVTQELDKCMDFWIRNSHDLEYGGFFNCLSKDGSVYDTTKYCWLQGRQIWTYCTLYNQVERFKRQDIYDKAVEAGTFLKKFAKNPQTGKCYFSVTRAGEPIKVQRTIFSEVFYVMAMASLYTMTNQQNYKDEALSMMDRLLDWTGSGRSSLGRPSLSGNLETSSLAEPMCLLSLLPLVEPLGWATDRVEQLEKDWVEEVLQHVQRNGSLVLETVSKEGGEIEGVAGRSLNPGHAIECGWFLLDLAKRKNNSSLAQQAIEVFIEKPLKYGWDTEHGGIYYFLDADGYSPTSLEWDMKLWWPHCEAMVATLMAYSHTHSSNHSSNEMHSSSQLHWQNFRQVTDYTISHFANNSEGEWLGYLDKQGQVKMDFKGGPYKGCFHVPRALFMCEKMLKQLV